MKRMLTYDEVCDLMLKRREELGMPWRTMGREAFMDYQGLQRYLYGQRVDKQGPVLTAIGKTLGLTVEQVYIVEEDYTLSETTKPREDETE